MTPPPPKKKNWERKMKKETDRDSQAGRQADRQTDRQTDRQRCRERNKSYPLVIISSSNGKDLRPRGKGFWDGVLVDSWTKPWAVWVAVNSDGDVGNVSDIRSCRVVHSQTQLSKQDTANTFQTFVPNTSAQHPRRLSPTSSFQEKRSKTRSANTQPTLNQIDNQSWKWVKTWKLAVLLLHIGYYCVVLNEQKRAPKG